MEMISPAEHKIARPRQLYTGPVRRDFLPIEQRG
jgi:citrate synthase